MWGFQGAVWTRWQIALRLPFYWNCPKPAISIRVSLPAIFLDRHPGNSRYFSTLLKDSFGVSDWTIIFVTSLHKLPFFTPRMSKYRWVYVNLDPIGLNLSYKHTMGHWCWNYAHIGVFRAVWDLHPEKKDCRDKNPSCVLSLPSAFFQEISRPNRLEFRLLSRYSWPSSNTGHWGCCWYPKILQSITLKRWILTWIAANWTRDFWVKAVESWPKAAESWSPSSNDCIDT